MNRHSMIIIIIFINYNYKHNIKPHPLLMIIMLIDYSITVHYRKSLNQRKCDQYKHSRLVVDMYM